MAQWVLVGYARKGNAVIIIDARKNMAHIFPIALTGQNQMQIMVSNALAYP
jgi:hypothetical protein